MPAFPPSPVKTIDWMNVKDLRIHEVNGHIESTYSRTTGKWMPLKFVRDPYIRIHGLAPGLNYGQQALEGFKVFRTAGDAGGIDLFRPERNAERFRHSAEVLSMPPVPTDMFIQACRAAVALNAEYVPPYESGGAMYVRPQLYGSSAHLGLTAPDEYTFSVFVVPTPGAFYNGDGGVQPVKALIVDEFDRAAPRGTGHAKVGGNYAPVLRWSDQARSQGFGITLHLDSAKHEEVDEFSTCAFIGVFHDTSDKDLAQVTLVVPDSPNVINSVTSDSVQHIARHCFGWKVEKRPIRYEELPLFSEALGSGTTVAMVPIRSITRQLRGERQALPASERLSLDGQTETIQYLSDEAGPVYHKLLAQLRAIQRGNVHDEFAWRVGVRAEDQDLEGRDKQ